MHLSSLIALILPLLPVLYAAPNPQEADRGKGCVVPLVIYNGFPNDFRLTAEPIDTGFPLKKPLRLLQEKTSSGQPTLIPLLSKEGFLYDFSFKDQVLSVKGGKEAYFLPVPKIFPPPLGGWRFESLPDGFNPAKFIAVYECDRRGKGVLVIKPEGYAGEPSLEFR